MRFLSALLPLVLAAGAVEAIDVPLTTKETHGFTRRSEHVSVGAPLPRGAVKDTARLAVLDADGRAVPAQFTQLAAWPDGSTKWVLVDFAADCTANGTAAYRLADSAAPPPAARPLKVSDAGGRVTIETGPMRAVLNRNAFDLFESVSLDHDRDGAFSDTERVLIAAGIRVTDARGREYSARQGKVKSFEVEARGPVRATVAVKGTLADAGGEGYLDYTLRLHFYEGSGVVRAFFTLENPANANPLPGNHWVLGRAGSRTFEDASLRMQLRFDGPAQMSVGDGREDILDRAVLTGKGGIYQDSSGGENWFHRNHMNAEGKIPLRFQGARVFLDGVEPYGRKRPDAWLHVADRRFGVAAAVRHFWQNFPKALSAEPDGWVRVALWPEESAAPHELQGGEIKTHEMAFFFHTGPQGSDRAENRVATAMGAFHQPLRFTAPPDWYLASGFFGDAVPHEPGRFPLFERYQQAGVASEGRNLFSDNEQIDEYGWRNFGDTWAKNEADKTGGPHAGREVVSHFNLEYDLGYGMLLQSLRTAGSELGRKWWAFAEAALRHESDIDVYHNTTDTISRGVYNGGKFTHSAHGVEAATSTHRGAPEMTWYGSLRWPWGQGSAPESGHFNTRGQVAYYLLTGDRRVLESAMEQTALVYRKVSENVFAQIGEVSRESGNNLQILTDAYLLTWDEKYRQAAEKILASTAPEKQWYTSAEGREKNAGKAVAGFWTAALAINAAARWTAVMEEKLGGRYEPGRKYVAAYADFAARHLAGGPERGFYMEWSPAKGGRGDHGPWTYRLADVVMAGHKYSDDPAVKQRCLKAAADAFAFMERRAQGGAPVYVDSKNTTMILGGGHSYTHVERPGARVPVILDTDIGTDIDDAFALALAVASPEIELRGVTTVSADAYTRALIACRMLHRLGRADVPVAAGRPQRPEPEQQGQYRYGLRGDFPNQPVRELAHEFLYRKLKADPGRITIVTAGDLTNVARLLTEYPEAKGWINRIVLMGGAVRVGYNGKPPAVWEWNIRSDIQGAQTVFSSGVPVVMAPLDATLARLDQPRRERIFGAKTAAARELQDLYELWGKVQPVLFDPVAVMLAFDESFCRMEDLRIEVDARGVTREVKGPPNARVAVSNRLNDFLDWYVDRIVTK